MSFSSNVKEELLNIEVENPCCVKSMAYGMLLFGRSFNYSSISLMTDNEKVAQKYKETVKAATGVDAALTVTQSGKYILSVESEEDRKAVFDVFNLTGKETSLRINRSILTNEADDENGCCFSSFIRGAFLSCATICDPNKMYSLEFIVPYMKLSEDLKTLLAEIGIEPKITSRKGVRIVYYKGSSNIEDVLTLMGATMSSLEIMSIKVYKDVRNRVNRRVNFENANISRMVNAAMNQIRAIEYISETVGIDALPEELRGLAQLRIENPDMSLRELGESFESPITRSAVNYRLNRIMEFYKNLIKETES